LLVGCAELGMRDLALSLRQGLAGLEVLGAPGLYLALIGMALAIGQGMIALQRGRMTICITVTTITAVIYTIAAGTLLFGGDRPTEPLGGLLRVAGLVVATAAIIVFPRHGPTAPHALRRTVSS
jgi:hypothetical protein